MSGGVTGHTSGLTPPNYDPNAAGATPTPGVTSGSASTGFASALFKSNPGIVDAAANNSLPRHVC